MPPLLGDASGCGYAVKTRERRDWVEPDDAGPDERDPEGCEAKGRGLNIKQYQAL